MALVQFEVQSALQPYKQTSVVQETKFLEQPLYQLTGHKGAVNECHFSPDGNILATCAGEVILWSLRNGEVKSLGALRPHKSPITSQCWNIDGTRFATSSADHTVAVQDTETGQIERRFKDHKDIVNTVIFLRESPNIVVSGDDSGYVIANDLRQSTKVASIKSKSPVTCLSLIKGDKISVAGVCGSIFVDNINGSVFKTNHRLNCQSIVFGTAVHPNGKYLAANESNATLTLFSIQDYFPNQDRIISQVSNGNPVKDIVPPRTAWSPDGKFVMSGSTDYLLRIWDVESLSAPSLVYSLPGHKGTVTGCDFHPQLPIIASCSTDNTIIVGELGE